MEQPPCNVTQCFYDMAGKKLHQYVGYDVITTPTSSSSTTNVTTPVTHWTNLLLANVTPFGATIGLLAALLLVFTTFGNTMVCFAITCDKRLQNTTNYFLMSLAVTDFMVALLVMPFGILVLVNGTFPLSPVYCVIYITVDVLLCTCSIFHLCILSVDRYLCLCYPMKFGRNKTKRRVVLKICVVWITSVALSVPLTLIYSWNDENLVKDGACVIQDRLFMVIGSIIAFYVPLAVMVVVHVLTMRLLRKVVAMKSPRKVNKADRTVTSANDCSATISTNSNHRESTITIVSDSDNDNEAVPEVNKDSPCDKTRGSDMKPEVTATTPPTTVVSSPHKPSKNGRYHQSERRATKILGIIFFTFVVLWTPFFALNFTTGACPTCVQHVPHTVFEVALWLGYASSTANPIIYTIFNPTFRQMFAKLLNLKFT